jgi:AcrR family transcriptional regulator
VAEKVDGRRARGDRTRTATATAAAEIATVTGLDSISMSGLARATGFSPSGILTVFDNREAIQLAAVERARERFVAEVVTPSWGARPGLPRLRKLVDNWFDYVDRRVFPGGCFLVATSVEYGAQQGPVADAVRELKQTWLNLLEGELRVGAGDSRRARDRARMTVFRLDAFMVAADIATRLTGDGEYMAMGRTSCRDLLASYRLAERG